LETEKEYKYFLASIITLIVFKSVFLKKLFNHYS